MRLAAPVGVVAVVASAAGFGAAPGPRTWDRTRGGELSSSISSSGRAGVPCDCVQDGTNRGVGRGWLLLTVAGVRVGVATVRSGRRGSRKCDGLGVCIQSESEKLHERERERERTTASQAVAGKTAAPREASSAWCIHLKMRPAYNGEMRLADAGFSARHSRSPRKGKSWEKLLQNGQREKDALVVEAVCGALAITRKEQPPGSLPS